MYAAGAWRHWDVNCDLRKLETNPPDKCLVGPIWVVMCLNLYFEVPPLKFWLSFGKDNVEYTKDDVVDRFERTAVDNDKSTTILSPQLLAFMDSCVYALTRTGPQGHEDEVL
jgi:hypothetical protein